jgi:threonine dehydratase
MFVLGAAGGNGNAGLKSTRRPHRGRDEPMTPDAIREAHERIRRHIRRTPVIDFADDRLGLSTPASLKLEFLQHAGSFKARGAFNNLLAGDIPRAGVVAASGGNHGAAVAYACSKLGIPARIFVPETSDPVKIERIRGYGAAVQVRGSHYGEALTLSRQYQVQSGAIELHAYDTPTTIAGQGTLALEWAAQAPDLDTLLVAVGGGGLIAGIAAWHGSDTRIVGVEPKGAPTLHAALASGGPVDVEINSFAADSLGARLAGTHVYDIASRAVDTVVLVEDDDIRRAQGVLWEHLRIVAEPGGACALAALLSGAYQCRPRERIGVLICGANVDPAKIS